MITLVTDSNGDIPAEWAQRLDIGVAPSIVNLEGRSYRDGVDLSRSEFYARLPGVKELPTTAAPGPGEFEALYRACPPGEIVSIHIAAKLSAICQSAQLGAEASGRQVTIVDSESMSMGLGWQVLAAAEAAAAGQPLAGVLAAARSVQQRGRVFAVIDTLEYLRRGGRANAAVAALGQWLQIKPMLEVRGGEVLSLARHRTRHKAFDGLVQEAEGMGPLERLAVLHANCEADARHLAERLASRAAQPPIIVEITSVLGVHLGPGALGVAAVRAE